MDVDGALALARWVYLFSAMALFGSTLFPLYAPREMPFRLARLPRGVTLAMALSIAVSAVAWLLLFASGLAGSEGTLQTLRVLLLESALGPVWLVRLSLVLLLVVVSYTGRPALIVGPALLLLVCQGWQGHAAALGLVGTLTQALHVTSAGAWIGGLLPLARLIAMAQRDPSKVTAAESVLWRFSGFGVVAVAFIASTGAMNTWWMFGGLPDPGNTYGQTLLLKVGLFAAMVGLALYNRFALLRRMKADPQKGLRTLSRSVALEQVIGLAVLLDVSALGLMNPHA